MLLALEEVNNGIVAYDRELIRRDRLRDAVDASQRAVDLVRTRYVSGLTNFQNLLDTLETVAFNEGDMVVKQGEPGDFYYIVQSGRCEVIRSGAKNREIKLAELKSGDTFGEEALISNAKRNASVRMVQAGELARMTKDDFSELIKAPLLNSVSLETARERVANGASWLDVRFEDLGEVEVKNIARPVPVFTVQAGGEAATAPARPSACGTSRGACPDRATTRCARTRPGRSSSTRRWRCPSGAARTCASCSRRTPTSTAPRARSWTDGRPNCS